MITQEETARHIEQMIGHALEGDSHKAADVLTHLGQNLDHHGMYGVCCGVAEVGKHCLTKIYGDQVPDTARGDMWAMQEVAPVALAADPAKAFGTRFLVAYANDDRDTAIALFRAALESSPEQYVDSVCSLLADVAGIARLALDQQKRE